jgi:DNA-binding NtrC family response regulator
MTRLLVADDDPMTCDFFKEILQDVPVDVSTCLEPRKAITLATEDRFDIVISDINFEQATTGIDVLKAIKAKRPETQVILVSGFGSLDTAIAAVREGAFDYISKPFNVDEVKTTVRRALEKRKAGQTADGQNEAIGGEPILIGSSAKMLAVYKNIAYVADSRTTILIQGESGTGKELVARAIHAKGPRGARPFIGVNCGALTETLLESELFGHVKGSFTGAVADKHGLSHAAQGGTLFLDEISETSPALQVKLLRVLQQDEYTPVGSTKVLKTDARVIAATNRDLESLVRKNEFREDLFYRLNVVTIEVPALRERHEDIPKLIAYFSRRLRAKGHTPPQFSSKALEALVRYAWPGNVRELENTIERLALFSRGRLIEVSDLPEKIRQKQAPLESRLFEALPPLEEMERRYLFHVLKVLGGNRKKAAEVLKIDRRTLYRMLDRFEPMEEAETSKRSDQEED